MNYRDFILEQILLERKATQGEKYDAAEFNKFRSYRNLSPTDKAIRRNQLKQEKIKGKKDGSYVSDGLLNSEREAIKSGQYTYQSPDRRFSRPGVNPNDKKTDSDIQDQHQQTKTNIQLKHSKNGFKSQTKQPSYLDQLKARNTARKGNYLSISGSGHAYNNLYHNSTVTTNFSPNSVTVRDRHNPFKFTSVPVASTSTYSFNNPVTTSKKLVQKNPVTPAPVQVKVKKKSASSPALKSKQNKSEIPETPQTPLSASNQSEVKQKAKDDAKSTPKPETPKAPVTPQPAPTPTETKNAVETAAAAAKTQGSTTQERQETAQAVARAQGKQKAKMSTKKKIGIGAGAAAGVAGLAIGTKLLHDRIQYNKFKKKHPKVSYKQWKAMKKKSLHESFNEGYHTALQEFYY